LPQSPCSWAQAVRPAAAARPPTNSLLFIILSGFCGERPVYPPSSVMPARQKTSRWDYGIEQNSHQYAVLLILSDNEDHCRQIIGPDPGIGAKPSMVRPMERPNLAFPGILGGLFKAIISHRPVETVSHAAWLVFAYHSVACIDKRLCAAIFRISKKK